MGGMTLAIVGSRSWLDGDIPEVKSIIDHAMVFLDPTGIISGGAVGVDTWAEEAAVKWGIPCSVFRPKNDRWDPQGYKERNRGIAHTCDQLLCIRSYLSTSFGSGWTADYAESIGKKVHRFNI